MSVLEKVRKWIDGETAEGVLEEAARDAQVKPRSQAEEFIVKIARSIEEVIQRELLPLPQGTAIIPSEYVIFLSQEDDRDWQGAKRRGLEQGLYHILAERAREIAGKRKLETEVFRVKLKVDGTLKREEIRIQHSWDDPSHSQTQVLNRGKVVPLVSPAQATDPNLPDPFAPPNLPPTSFAPQGGPPDDMTRVASRHAVLYKLEVWRNGTRMSVIPITTRDTVIGRGSTKKPVDVPLSGDLEISRRHLVLSTDGVGSFWVLNEGRNPVLVNDVELQTGLQVRIQPGTLIGICSYMLRIQA